MGSHIDYRHSAFSRWMNAANFVPISTWLQKRRIPCAAAAYFNPCSPRTRFTNRRPRCRVTPAIDPPLSDRSTPRHRPGSSLGIRHYSPEFSNVAPLQPHPPAQLKCRLSMFDPVGCFLIILLFKRFQSQARGKQPRPGRVPPAMPRHGTTLTRNPTQHICRRYSAFQLARRKQP